MTYYHIIIATERRTEPERMATSISRSEPTGKTIDGMQEYVAGPAQLHSFTAAGLPENIDNPKFVMVVEWDGTSPYVIQHKGDYAARTMGFAGWPELTKDAYDALHVDPL